MTYRAFRTFGRIGSSYAPIAVWVLAGVVVACGPRGTTAPGDGGTLVGDGGGDGGSAVTCAEADLDQDGYGEGCPAGPDCDETDPAIHFRAEEICDNGVDENCNGTPDDGCPGVDCTDADGDGWAAGPDCVTADCDDSEVTVYPGAVELCDGLDNDCDGEVDEGLLNACGDCQAGCDIGEVGSDPFPMPADDPEHVEADGVGLDPNGDIVLDQAQVNFNFLWISNTTDLGRGTVSKVDTQSLQEVGRYYSVTCFGNPAWQNGECLDTGGNPINLSDNRPSRTAVDFNFDVWVANRAFNLQASATKIANAEQDCIDRNGNGVIETSRDLDGDGHITTDCNGDGVADDGQTQCTNGLPAPEFYGLDDECVLHTTNYATVGSLGRSIALDAGDPYSGGHGNAWVGTCRESAGANEVFKINGQTGTLEDLDPNTPGIQGLAIPGSVECIYGLAVDGHGILWGTDYHGYLFWVDTQTGTYGGTLTNPFLPPAWCTHYGIAIDGDQNVWLAACSRDKGAYRYRPDRSTPSGLGQGTWTRITLNRGIHSRGIAVDTRGFVWLAHTDGFVTRIPSTLPDGTYDGEALGYPQFNTTGTGTIGVGVDFTGNIWGINDTGNGLSTGSCTRIVVDANGDPTGQVDSVPVGTNPYTYSDFTGFGLRNFTRPEGTYTYLMEGCPEPAQTQWDRVEWNATEPAGTGVAVRVRTGDDPAALGAWYGEWTTSPAVLDQPPEGPVSPNPAAYLQVQFVLTSANRDETPILHDFRVVRHCLGGPN